MAAPPRCGPGIGACPQGMCCGQTTRTCASSEDDDTMATDLCSADQAWATLYNGPPTARCERDAPFSTPTCSGTRGAQSGTADTMRCGPAVHRLCPWRKAGEDLCCIKHGGPRGGVCASCGKPKDQRWAWDEASRKWIIIS
jgi:hypothetical protein